MSASGKDWARLKHFRQEAEPINIGPSIGKVLDILSYDIGELKRVP
jgi:hypothetical protein